MKSAKLSALTDGTHTLDLSYSLRGGSACNYDVQCLVKDANGDAAVPATGTATLKVSIAHGLPAEDIANGAIDLTARANWLQSLDQSTIHTLTVVVASLEADHTLDVTVLPSQLS